MIAEGVNPKLVQAIMGHSNYTTTMDTYVHTNTETLRDAANTLGDTIAAIPRVDVLTLGPWDLSLSLGLNPLDLPLPDVDAVLSRMVEVARTGQVSAGGGVDTPEELREFYARGVMFLEFGTDYSLLANAVQQSLRVFQE